MASTRTASATRGSDGARDARIASGARVRGRIAGDGDLTIEGAVEGDIALRGALVIAEGGSATSDVEASEVTIAGTLEGSVSASGHVRVSAGSRVRGDLRASAVEIEEGAQYAGRLESEFELPAELEQGSSRARR